ncbi:DUF3533 domain-containing protein [Nocardioides mangrovicus]|uniref:DUF3533 domain-containing protein n=1 Tax=Nocardioides mangrovicus TaxID=2478913 RepID=A0A3L8P8Q6_9ACTN|nr:DUF3533 domain-containing protein [Nocardioides mangrovicus]RLV51139.1 DUF3533 domain-containing protein [Nocardioides mangrovicus]
MAEDVSFTAELKDAIAPRTVLLVLGVLALQLGFVASYVGAFHHPTAHDLRVGIVGPSSITARVEQQLKDSVGDEVSVTRLQQRATAVEQIRQDRLHAALVVDSGGTTDELLVASGGGSSLVSAVQQAAEQAEAEQQRSLTTTDLVPLQSGDARGLSGFYLTIGWLVGGYLMASLLGVARGSRPANPRRAVIRLLAQLPYAAAAGLGGALVVDQWLGALTGHFWALAGTGTLLVLAAATVTTALQVLCGTLGIGLAVLVFVVLGNPSAGGAFGWPLLPWLWRTIGPWLPNGAGTEALRRTVYFAGRDAGGYLLVIALWAAVGVVVTLAVSRWRHSREAVAA